jgi:MFS family permease
VPAAQHAHLRFRCPGDNGALNTVFQLLTLVFGLAHIGVLFALSAIISGGLSGANFPMTAAMVADYYGETDNAVNYGSIYAWKALGGSFTGGIAALIMTGTLYGEAHFNWPAGFIFGACLAAAASVIVYTKAKAPTVAEMQRAVEASARQTTPTLAVSS